MAHVLAIEGQESNGHIGWGQRKSEGMAAEQYLCGGTTDDLVEEETEVWLVQSSVMKPCFMFLRNGQKWWCGWRSSN